MAQSSKTANTVLVPDLEKLRLDENKVSGDPENPTDTSKNASNAPNGAYGAAMASFRGSRPRIRRLLDCLNLEGFDSGSVEIEPIQHGAEFTNCVYGLVPASSSTEQLILRVVVKNSQGLAPDARNEGLESDIALLSFLKDKLPVPQIKAYDLTTDNALKAAYTIQTRIPGHSLNHLWEQMDQSEKCDIIDEFIVLLAKLESIEFPAAGYFDVKAPLPAKKDDFSGTIDVVVHHFVAVSDGSLQDPKVSEDRAGIDIEKLLKSLLDDWIKQYQIEDDPPAVTIFKNLLTMGSDMEKEGYFKEQRPIVLHHWDLEPRNIMVSKESGAWKICGIIDWDQAMAQPLPLTRNPPTWMWQFDPDEKTPSQSIRDKLNADHWEDPKLSEKQLASKEYFDAKVEKVLPGYCEDAYGKARWLRRMLFWALEGAEKDDDLQWIVLLQKEWKARSKPVV